MKKPEASGSRRQNIHIWYDLAGFSPVGTLGKQETAWLAPRRSY